MRIAVLTDIHANREALEAVLADAAQRGADRIAILGDIVGYGPDPAWCVDRVMRLVQAGAICVQGNHDLAAARGPDAGFSSTARAAILWTATMLDPSRRAFLAGLPLTHSEDGVLYVHASANDPADWLYVTSADKAHPCFRVAPERVILCGHVHKPLLVSCDAGGVVREAQFPDGHFPIGRPQPLIRSRRWLAVVGAVGQPRDGSPAAGYAILDLALNDLTFLRVPYDCDRTAAKIRAAYLPDALAHRLTKGA